jgi:simple sugar transport system ATP-binding protein
VDDLIVSLQEVWKTFRGVDALRGVSLGVAPGEIACLLGDNGAGKSTLVKVITGVHRPDRGQLLVDGRAVDRWTPRRAREAGIETIFQDKALVVRQTVARNIFMGRELTSHLGFISDRKQAEEADLLLRRLGFTSRVMSVNAAVSGLSGGEREGVAIARAMYFGARLMILDEPTTALSLRQSQRVLDLVLDAKATGIGILFISHNISHAYAVGDRFLILDRGLIAAEFHKADIGQTELIEFMESEARGEGTDSDVVAEII